MKLKSMSKILICSVIINSFSINSFAGVLSPDNRYEMFNEDRIIIDNMLEEDAVDIGLEGFTFANIMYDNQKVEIKGNPHDAPSGYLRVDVPIKYPLKANTEYTISFDITKNSCNHPPFHSIVFGQGDVDLGNGTDSWSYRLYGVKDFEFKKEESNIGSYKLKFTTPSRIEETSFTNIKFIAHGDCTSYDTVIDNINLIKGDLSQNSISVGINDIQSSFEDQLVTQEMVNSGEESIENLGKYKVEIESRGKNLFNGKMEPGGINANGENILSDSLYRCVDYIDVENVKKVVANYPLNYLWFDKDKKVIGSPIYGVPANSEMVKPKGAKYLRVHRGSLVNDLQIEEGSVSTDYEPYKKVIKKIYLNSPLLRDDTIELINSQLYHVRRSEKVVLDGSEDWRLNTSIDIPYLWYMKKTMDTIPVDYVDSDMVLCNKLDTDKVYNSNNKYGIALIGTSKNIRIRMEVMPSVSEFKESLKNDPIVFVYKLANPVYEPLNSELSVNVFEGDTFVTNKSSMPATMKIVVDRVANRAKEAIELSKLNPTIENISQARYWTNLMRESALKDDFQGIVNDNIDIEDLSIEKKISSVNADVYIKMKNALSLSLDTNSIIFEDFNASEDLEISNAVNLTVNSSLPYKINAYLEEEIYNSDKSVILDKSILNIKLSEDNIYRAFINTLDPVELINNCSEGSNNVHSVDFRLNGGMTSKADVYKTTIRFEIAQQ